MMQDWKDALSSLLESASGDEDVVICGNAVGISADSSASDADAKTHPVLRLFFEKKGRGGKAVTIVEGFAADGSEDEDCGNLAAILKKRLGRGGSARGGEILIQGDCRVQLREMLKEMGYVVKG